MKKIIAGIMLPLLAVFGVLFAGTVAQATPPAQNQNVCAPLDSGKIDAPAGTGRTLTISAPEGFLIAEFCVKAGSAQQGLGPENIPLLAPAASYTITHTSGKDISHYSARYVPIPVETTTPSEPPVETEDPEPTPVLVPQIQDYVGLCDAAFVLDNKGSNESVVYTINGEHTFIVPGGSVYHTDADGLRIDPLENGTYVIVTDTGRTWTFPGNVCVDTPPIDPETPVDPEPSTPSSPEPSTPASPQPSVPASPEASTPVETEQPTPTDEVELIPPFSSEQPEPTPTVTAPAPTQPPAAGDAGPADTLPRTGSEINWGVLVILAVSVLLLGFIVYAVDRNKKNGPRL